MQCDLFGFMNIGSLGNPVIDRAFLASLHWDEMPRSSLLHYYHIWTERVEALRSANLTGTYKLCLNDDDKERRRSVLHQYDKLQFEEDALRRQRTVRNSAVRFVKQNRIQQIAVEKAPLIESLRAIDNGAESTPREFPPANSKPETDPSTLEPMHASRGGVGS